MHPILNIAIQAAIKGGNNIIQAYDKNTFNYLKNKEILQKEIYKTKNMIINLIKKSYFKHHILFNYNSSKLKKFKNPTWIINLIHGKKNFKKRFPNFCVSITIFVQKKINSSVIYDPLKNELFTAVNGHGAQINGHRMRSSKTYLLKKIFVSAKINYMIFQKNHIFYKILKKIFKKGIIFRSTNLVPLDLAYLANGRIDCIIEYNFKIKNYYSGILHVKETGGIISDYQGGFDYNNKTVIIANNAKVLSLILKKIKSLY
ncbi:inositol monophosphatase family protein [Buchnera aphidicola]|uniref:inositol monophosphatase family protein n=1 Tax=Buchnera aphidicola TaxID=9 RepID=UPI002237FB6A|nr:inositol monophosphatase family protein [Buchnera aphidicola]MCW5197691.1 inositol monophosphatase [Buchnera aphidicola (Chaitophorus viminalis)]